MNKMTLPLLLLAGGILSFPATADDSSITLPGIVSPGDVTLRKKPKPVPPPVDPDRPRSPAATQYLHASFEDGVLFVDFPEETESATVTLSTGAFSVFSAGIDRGYPCVELPDLTGDFLLNVTFDNGDEYEGEISF
ncbi:MAG: hypothetical protein K2M67_08395 [Muribaculaceae bacterium]|nr:hypothetical protein [Muribaculaceae bacterium]